MRRSAPARPRAAAGARPPGSARAAMSGVSPGEHGHALLARAPRRCRSLVDRWTVAAVSATPAASASSTACAPGNAGSSAGVHVDDPAREAGEEARAQEVHVAGAARRAATPRASSQSAIAASRSVAVGVVLERERGRRRSTRPRPARARGRPRRFDATAAIGRPASIRACRFVPLAADEHADHPAHPTPSIPAVDDPPDHEVVARDVGRRDDGAVADPDVEDAAQLVLGDAVRRRASRTPRAAPRTTGRRPRRGPSGRTRARLPAMPPPVTWASPRTSARARSARTSSR